MRKLLVIRRRGKLKMKSRNVLQLQYESEKDRTIIKEYPIRDLEAVVIIGNGIYIESGVVSVLSSMNIPVAVLAKDNVGILYNSVIVVNPHYRRLQYSVDKIVALKIAFEYIKAKIAGMMNILRYYRVEIPVIPKPLLTSNTPEDLEYDIRLWESQASNILWDKLVELIREPLLEELKSKYGFQGRRPRHPDPFNKVLSVMYAVLYSLGTKALLAAGLDPTYGFFHRTRYSTPLTFDYIEMFKPIAIEATINMVNNKGLPELNRDGELKREHINTAIKMLYSYLVLKHKDTGKTPYQQIYLKAFCLAKYLEGKCRREWLTVTWNRAQYRARKTRS